MVASVMVPKPLTKRSGFTLFELLIVISVLSIWSAFTIAQHFEEPDITLESAAVLVAKDLRTAQDRSAYLGEPARFELNPDGYRLVDRRGRVVRHPRSQEPFHREWTMDAVFDGIQVEGLEPGESRAIEIDRSGGVRSSEVITLSFRGEERSIKLYSATSRIVILGSTSDWIDQGR